MLAEVVAPMQPLPKGVLPKGVLSDDTLAVLAQGDLGGPVSTRLAREVQRLRRRLANVEHRRSSGRLERKCLAVLRTPGTVADVAERCEWSYNRARTWVYVLHHRKQIKRVDSVRMPSGQVAGRYVVV